MAYNLNPFITSKYEKVHAVSDCMGFYDYYINENIIAKADKNRLVVLRKTSSVLSYKS